jgi:tetratricopeptide (TPR) repeat protein
MSINSDTSIITGLTALYGATYQHASSQSAAASSTTSTASMFGPATLLSLGQSTTTDETSETDFDYTQLASLALQARAPTTPQIPASQQKAEQAAIKRANGLRLQGDYDDARTLLNELLAKNPSNGVAVHGLGAIELDQGNYEKAEQLFGKADYLSPGKGFDRDAQNARILQQDDDTVLEQARRLTKQDDTRGDGIRLLINLTRRSPSNTEARMLLARNLIEDGDASNGLAQYQLAISTASHTQLGEIELELAGLTKVAPKAAYLRNLLGQAQLGLAKYEQAAVTLGLASQLSNYDPLYLADEARAYVGIGRAALERGDITAAMGAFNTARNLDPVGEEVKLALAEGYAARAEWRIRIGDAETAVDDFETAEFYLGSLEDDEVRDRIAAGAYRAGLILERRRESSGEDVGKEIVAFQTAYDLDSDNLTYRRKLAETRNAIGDEYWEDEDYEQAAYAYRRAYELEPRNETYRDNAINAFLAFGDEQMNLLQDYTEAIAAYRAAYEIDTTHETAKFKLAEAYNTRGLEYKSQGLFELAFLDFREALHLFPDNEEYQANYDSVNPDGG